MSAVDALAANTNLDEVLRPGAVVKTELQPGCFHFWLESNAGRLPLAIVAVTDESAQWSHLFSRALGHWLKIEDCLDPFANLEQMQEVLEHFCTATAEQYSYGAIGTGASMSDEVYEDEDDHDATKRQVAELKQENSDLKSALRYIADVVCVHSSAYARDVYITAKQAIKETP